MTKAPIDLTVQQERDLAILLMGLTNNQYGPDENAARVALVADLGADVVERLVNMNDNRKLKWVVEYWSDNNKGDADGEFYSTGRAATKAAEQNIKYHDWAVRFSLRATVP